MAKLSAQLQQALSAKEEHGLPAGLTYRRLADTPLWTVDDVLCTAGPRDHSYEEQHKSVRIVIVLAGNFQYRSGGGRELMTPGSLLLGNDGQCFECGHEHGAGDRCLSFGYDRQYFERLAADVGVKPEFRKLRLPVSTHFSPIVAKAAANLIADDAPWEELSITLAAQALKAASNPGGNTNLPQSSVARVARTIRMVEHDLSAEHSLDDLAKHAGLSSYHFLRTFRQLTGLTPHKYVVRARLREAAVRVAAEPGKIVDIALECGFGDVSNFNRAFRAEFGVPPGQFRTF